jgi:stearoyl-CoA desaturase (delta-9 desaturase)
MEIESLKKYSQLIEDLKISGSDGVAGKSGDISTTVRKTSAIKGDPSLLHAPVQTVERVPRLDSTRLTGGLGHAIEA